jgi:hypothetical protein
VNDLFGFVAFNEVDNQIIVAFRGTNGFWDFKNWIMNLEIDKI